MNSGKTRSTLLGIVGAYLIYLAYQLFEGRSETDTSMTPAARIAFIVFFAVAGAAVFVYALRVWKKSRDEEQEKPKEDENSLK